MSLTDSAYTTTHNSHFNPHYLSSSIYSTTSDSSHHPRRGPSHKKPRDKTSSEITKCYKHASQLYLTRRLRECYDALQPIIRPPSFFEVQENGYRPDGLPSASEDEAIKTRVELNKDKLAPIAMGSTSQRIKMWSLYATLLHTICDLEEDAKKQEFGGKLCADIVANVHSGEIWEEVVRDGYGGREERVDGEVVYNLSNLLLGQSLDQTINQSRLETWLASTPQVDLSAAFASAHKNGYSSNGMNTPRDLNSRVKILELFVLHVLPRNDEWEYAKSFINNSDVLDEERREAFLATLEELQAAKQAEDEAERERLERDKEHDLVGFAEETEEEEEDEKIRMHENDEGENTPVNGSGGWHDHLEPRITHDQHIQGQSHKRGTSEIDYGIDEKDMHTIHDSGSPPRRSVKTPSTIRTISPTPSAPPPSTASQGTTPSTRDQKTAYTPPQTTAQPNPKPTSKSQSSSTKRQASTPNKKSSIDRPQPQSAIARTIRILTNLSNLISSSLTRNPTQVFRTIMFLFAILMVLSRKDVRDRLRRMISQGWAKVRQTAIMGGKVSYI